ncbi:MAG: PIN domain-containing protein [Roseitalea sp.]|jgi:predicted nucleic acid-binding protein|nr:PIN domain-containing protein [Roseitalea sp.]MBO6722543.1 PIN domain-containing protein [Roseitalea sp.]MBO6742317.1 PIN domain-containing protein [Roseitalea sp.]
MPVFVDTNIVLYAISTDPRETAKRDIAYNVLQRDDFRVSTQVLLEFYAQATRPGSDHRISHGEASDIIIGLRRTGIIDVTQHLVFTGLELRRITNYSMWDCMIIAAAKAGGCDTLLSEDMDHGHAIAGVTILNPFAEPA